MAQKRELLAALQVDPALGKTLAAEVLAATEEPDPVEIAQALDGAGIAYPDALRDPQYALDHAGQTLGEGVPV